MTQVFISYVRENQQEIDQICRFLRGNGVRPWLDRDEIRPGTFWKDAIRTAIKEGDYFIACFSQEYNRRLQSYMNEELNVAISELRKRKLTNAWFIPLLLSGEVPEWEIGPGRTLRDLQWIDLKAHSREHGLARLLSALKTEPAKQDSTGELKAPVVTRDANENVVSEIRDRPKTSKRAASTEARKRSRNARVEIRRPKQFVGSNAVYNVVVDDKYRASLQPGGNVGLDLRAGLHEIYLYYYKPTSVSAEMATLLDHPRFGAAGKDVYRRSNTVTRKFKAGERVLLLSTTSLVGMRLKEI